MLRFWQHMAAAGLIEGNYTGLLNGAYTAGVNIPASKIGNNAGWRIAHYNTAWAGNASNFAQPSGTQIYIGGNTADYILKPEELWNMDTKLDDGKPGTGMLTANKGDATYPCTDKAGVAAPGDAGAAYNLSNRGTICWSIIFNAF